MKYLFCLYLIASIITTCSGQNGQYISEGYLFYKSTDDSNPQETKHKYSIDISVSDFTGQGKITIKDLYLNIVFTHLLNGKIKEEFDEKTKQNIIIYSSSISIYNLSQTETLLLLFNETKTSLNCIVCKSSEYSSEGYYCDIQAIGDVSSSTGSGFFVSSLGYLVTNYHVVKGAKEIQVCNINGKFSDKYVATLIDFDVPNDIALLKIKPLNIVINYGLNKKNKEIGDEIFVLGYPMISLMGSQIKLTTGVISSTAGYMNNDSYYQISSPIQPGNSGSPLFDYEGNVIGLVTSVLTNGVNVGYALKSSIILGFLAKNKINSQIQPSNLKGTLSQKVKFISPSIVTIISKR